MVHSVVANNEVNGIIEDGLATIQPGNVGEIDDMADSRPIEIESEGPRKTLALDETLFRSFFGSSMNMNASQRSVEWKTIGSRRIRYSSHVCYDNIEERRGIVAIPLGQEQGTPMGKGTRFFRHIRGNFHDDELPNSSCDGGVRMFRLQATRASDVGFCRKFLSFLYAVVNCGAMTDSSVDTTAMNPNRWVTNFFYWLFRKGWTTVIMVALLSFYTLVLLFTILIVISTIYVDDDCVRVGGLPFGTIPNRSRFADAFSLSWNTFSTVGYGSTYPALSTEHDHDGDRVCTFISFLASFEAFVGVIYGGFTGAVIFAKVTRISQRARVKFSDPLLIKFGAGVDTGFGGDQNSSYTGVSTNYTNNELENVHSSQINTVGAISKMDTQISPFPVLEFRIANELHNVLAGEIIGSQINAVVVLESQKDSEEVSECMAKQIKNERVKRTSRRVKKTSLKSANFSALIEGSTKSTTSSISENEVVESHLQNHVLNQKKVIIGSKKIKIDEEDTGDQIAPQTVFAKLPLDHSAHPFFKRLWTYRHTIDGDSPLLSTSARQRLSENNGRWPCEWNNPDDIRNVIRFNHVIVSFTGVSNISAISVFKQQVYSYVDLIIGYQFVNPLYRGRGGKLKVDLKLINDVAEQHGGCGEILNVTDRILI